MFLYFPQELVHKLEGFKHISWKKDQDTDGVFNFTFSIAELSSQSSCLEGAGKVETTKKQSTNTAAPGSVVDCTGQGVSCSSTVLTAVSLENEMSESDLEVGDTEQYGDVCSGTILEGSTFRVPLSTNERVAGSEGKRDVAESNTTSCMILETTREGGHLLSDTQTNFLENMEFSEMQRVKDETLEYCGSLKEINLPVDCMQDIVSQCSQTPIKVDSDTTVPNGYSTQGSLLNSTFVLPQSSPSHMQEKTPRKLVDRSNAQPKLQITGNK